MAPPVIKAGPVTRVCHVCGRQYGLSSFEIHVKQCKKLFIAQEELKPKSERRPVPKTPPGLDGSGAFGFEVDGAIGAAADGGAGNGARLTREQVEAMNRAAQETFNEHGMEKCDNCGRTFAEGRLAIHLRSCRPGHTAKRIDDGAAPRNKKEEVEYGRVRASDRPEPAEAIPSAIAAKKSAVRPPTANKQEVEDGARPRTASSGSGSAPRALSGSLATNRKKVASQDADSSDSAVRGFPHSPLDQGVGSISANALQQELRGKDDTVVRLIQAKLDNWEATTLATLQEIRDLKQLFVQLQEQ